MPIYKGNTEIASGKLYKAAINIENGYKGTDSFYINETQISFTDYPNITPNPKIFTGVPGDSVSPTASVSWSISAPSGTAFQYAPTISGLQSPYTYSVSGYGSTSNTTATFTVTGPNTYPLSNIDSDYDNLSISAPTSTVNTASVSISTSNYSGSGGSTFGSSVTGSIGGQYYTQQITGGSSGTSCSAGRYVFGSYNISGYGSASFSQTTSVSLPGLSAPGSYSGTVGNTGANTWAAWLSYSRNDSAPGCNPAYACWEASPTWTGAGGGSLNVQNNGGNCTYTGTLIVCPNYGANSYVVVYFSNSGGYGGYCTVEYDM
jgi:hypothetical protein